MQKTANSTTANRRLLDTLFLSTAFHGLVHCPLVLACRHAAVGDVASNSRRRRPTETTQNSLSCERRSKKEGRAGVCEKGQATRPRPGPSQPTAFLSWSCGHGLAMHAAGVHADETNRHCAFWLSGIVSLTFARFVGNLAARRRGVPAAAARNRKKMHDARF